MLREAVTLRQGQLIGRGGGLVVSVGTAHAAAAATASGDRCPVPSDHRHPTHPLSPRLRLCDRTQRSHVSNDYHRTHNRTAPQWQSVAAILDLIVRWIAWPLVDEAGDDTADAGVDVLARVQAEVAALWRSLTN
jgi:hypothetical protein